MNEYLRSKSKGIICCFWQWFRGGSFSGGAATCRVMRWGRLQGVFRGLRGADGRIAGLCFP